MKRSQGFTVIELIVVIVVLGISAAIPVYQRANIEASRRDDDRKTAINAMYYNLEEVFFEKNGYYPSAIDSKTLPAMDPELFTDPNGVELGEAASEYRYDPTDCEEERCKSYKLTAFLEKEADYIKTSRQ